jgi:hypothetical protein
MPEQIPDDRERRDQQHAEDHAARHYFGVGRVPEAISVSNGHLTSRLSSGLEQPFEMVARPRNQARS